jgi:hypothetical protein
MRKAACLRSGCAFLDLRAFSGEVDTGSPLENAITQRETQRIPIPLEWNSL